MYRRTLIAALLVVAFGAAPGLGATGTVRLSGFGIDSVSAAGAGDGTVAVWAGEIRGATAVAAERAGESAPWRRRAIGGGGEASVIETDVAANTRGEAVAIWAELTTTAGVRTIRIMSARRNASGAWGTPLEVATYEDPDTVMPTLLPSHSVAVALAPDGTALAAVAAPDGTVVARIRPAGAAGWGPATSLHGASAARLAPAVALAIDATGDAVALWGQNDDGAPSIGWAELAGGTWSAAAPLPGAAGGFSPAIARAADGRWVAAFSRAGTWALERRGAGWSAPVSVGGGYAPRIAAGPHTTAITWTGAPGMVVRAAGAPGWRRAGPPIAPDVAAVARDGSVLVAGLTEGQQTAWSRLPAGGTRWTPFRVVSRPQDVQSTRPVALVARPSGSLATLLWRASVVPGRLGARGGDALQFADLAAATGAAAGSPPLLRIQGDPRPRPAGAVVTLTPQFRRYTGPVRARIELNRGAGWRTYGVQTVGVSRTAAVRMLRPGRVRARLRYGRGFRAATNTVVLRIVRPARRRVVAGWAPRAVASHGRDLWVLGQDRLGRYELRLLDARTGRLRRGPVALPERFIGPSLYETGVRVLLVAGGDRASTTLDATRPGLLGPSASVANGGCAAVCTPVAVTVGGRDEHPARSGGFSAVAGPDGRIWGLVPSSDIRPDGSVAGTLVEAGSDGAPVSRGAVGPVDAHGGFTAEMAAVRGGVYIRDAFGAVTFFGPEGPGVAKERVARLAASGGCVWGLQDPSGQPSLIALHPFTIQAGPPVSLGQAHLSQDDLQVTVAGRTAWAVVPFEQTLVRVPLPAC